jgi:DNA end-binding protein Ku
MKSLWKGSISFGLVSIPIRIYSAIEHHVIGFKLLHEKCHTPIQYKDWCVTCKKEVVWQDIVKGLMLPNGRYFVITKEKLRSLRPAKTEQLTISEFIDKDELALIYIENHYYIGPEKTGQKAYTLFKKALQETHKIAIGQIVMREKEYVCALSSYKDVLLLTTLNYENEIRDSKEIVSTITASKIPEKELALAKKLITQLTSKKLVLSHYKDTFAQQLAKLIKKGSKSSKSIVKEKKKRAVKTPESDLSSILRQSLTTKKSKPQPVAYARSSRRSSRKG